MVNDLQKYIDTKKSAEKKVKIGAGLIIVGALGLLLGGDIGVIILAVGVVAGAIFAIIGGVAFQKLSKTFKIEVITKLMEELMKDGLMLMLVYLKLTFILQSLLKEQIVFILKIT